MNIEIVIDYFRDSFYSELCGLKKKIIRKIDELEYFNT